MTISSQTRTAGPFIGNGSATGGTFTFKIFNATEMTVVETNTSNVDRPLVYGTDFNVSLNADQNASPGGTINYLIAGVGPSIIPTGYALNATSNVPNLQNVALTNNGGFFPKVINDALDKLTILVQQLVRGVNASIKFPLSDGTSLVTELPNKAARALKAIVFDSNGNVTVSTDNFNNSATAAAASAAAAAASAASATADQNGKWTFATAVTMTDPGTGGVKLNNATVASATAMAISALTNDSGNPNIRTWIAAWDDSTNAVKGTIKIVKSGTPSTFAIFNVTGALTDNTTWLQLALTYVTGGGSFANNDSVYISFVRAGDVGGTGDFSSNTATSVDGEMILFSGTGGKTGKRSTLTGGGVLVTNSGIPSAVAPSTSGNVLTSNGSAWVSAAANAGAMVLLLTQTASASASLNFDSSIITNTYKEYVFEFINIYSTGNDDFAMVFSKDNGSTFITTNYNYHILTLTGTSSSQFNGSSVTEMKIQVGGSNTAVRALCGTLKLFDPLSTTSNKKYTQLITGSTGSAFENYIGGGESNIDTNAINYVRFKHLTGSTTGGIIKCYGVL